MLFQIGVSKTSKIECLFKELFKTEYLLLDYELRLRKDMRVIILVYILKDYVIAFRNPLKLVDLSDILCSRLHLENLLFF